MKKILLLIIALLFVACNDNSSSTKEAAPKNDKYSLISLNSKAVEFTKKENILSNNDNKPYLLVFLTTQCDYCLGQAQHIADINNEFKDKLNIYGVFADKNADINKLKDFVKKSNTNFEWYYKGDTSKLADSYHIKTFPYMLLYDKNGNLVMSYDGLTPEEMISFDIKKIL